MKNILFLIALISILSSCEKVIDVPLNEAEQQFIVEAVLTDVPFESYILLSKSGSVYQETDFTKVSGANITVTDQITTWTFIEDPLTPGTYLDTTFVAQANTTYYLSVSSGTEVFTAESHTNSDVAFDSLDYYYIPPGFGGGTDSIYFVFQNYTDEASEVNYYRVLPFVNGERDGTEYLNDDKLFNGNNFRQPLFATELLKGDTLDLLLISMDQANYKFFYSLGNAQDGGPFSPSPSNPVTNIEGGAIGYFGVYMTYSEQIIFPE